jgi:hypothetical protein
MAFLYITEFDTLGRDNNNNAAMAAVVPPLAEQAIAITGTSAQSAAMQTGTKIVRLMSDVVCSVKFGTNPTATTGTMRLAADSAEYFAVPAGVSFEVAVITNT